ncbi:radical SAM protein [Nitrospira defluvii]|nr:radical SAM protein [Nitrospira defluvii]
MRAVTARYEVKINEIYQSIQGESTYAGLPCVFIRTSGCNLRCRWCDTAYAFEEGEEKSLEVILQEVQEFDCSCVELTGGEPLLQKESLHLVTSLLDEGHLVLIETGGSYPIRQVDPRAVIILDIKCPGSGMQNSMVWENIKWLKEKDEVKFVIADRVDFDWAKDVLKKYKELKDKIVHFSPVFGEMDPKHLAEWILEEKLSVRLQIQMHKYIWDPTARGV